MGRGETGLVFGFWLLLLLVTVFTVELQVSLVKGSGIICIRADGTVDPPTAPIQCNGRVYIFTDNIRGEVIVQRSSITIRGNGYRLQGSGSGNGFYLSGANRVRIEKVEIMGFEYGIYLHNSSYNIVLGNNITNNGHWDGIRLSYSSYNIVLGNNITNNNGRSVYLDYSSNNTIFGNVMTNNYEGVSLLASHTNNICGNNITDREIGVTLRWSINNTISGNNITNNNIGVAHRESSDNKFYHNNFVNNTEQVYDPSFYEKGYEPSINTWDDGYPSGGNHWSDYNGTDQYSGPYQNETGNDGVGDESYAINKYNQDRYPSTNLWLDTNSPVTLNDYDGLWYSEDFEVTLTAVDDKSGVNITYYKINGGLNKTVSTDGHPLITMEEDDNTLEYWSIDKSGNEELPHKTLTGIRLDKTPPTIGIPCRTPEGQVLPSQSVKASVKITDATSEVKNATLRYTLDNGTTWEEPLNMDFNSSTGLYQTTIQPQPAGAWVEFKIFALDSAGNSAVLGGMEPYCNYQVVPEFSTAIIPLFMLLSLSVIMLAKTGATRRTKNRQSPHLLFRPHLDFFGIPRFETSRSLQFSERNQAQG